MHATLSWSDTASRDKSLSWQAGVHHTVNLLIFNTAVGMLNSQYGDVALPMAGWGVAMLSLLAFMLPALSSAPFSPASQQGVGFAAIYGLIILAAGMQHGLSSMMLPVLAAVATTAWMAPARLQMSKLAVCLACLLCVALLMLPALIF